MNSIFELYYEDEEMLITFDDDEIVYLVDVEIDYRYK